MVPPGLPWSVVALRESPVSKEPMSKEWEASIQEMSSVDGALLVAASVEVDGADPQPNNDTGGSLQDLVMRGTGIGVPRRAVPGDAAPAPGSSRATGPRVSRPLILGYLGFPPLPIDWRLVGGDAEFTCLRVATVERLLHETLASIYRNILHLIRVSLKKEKKICLHASSFLQSLSSPLVFIYAAPISG
jgi:hypothetical protein